MKQLVILFVAATSMLYSESPSYSGNGFKVYGNPRHLYARKTANPRRQTCNGKDLWWGGRCSGYSWTMGYSWKGMRRASGICIPNKNGSPACVSAGGEWTMWLNEDHLKKKNGGKQARDCQHACGLHGLKLLVDNKGRCTCVRYR